MERTKINRFVKDEKALKQVFDVHLKYYEGTRNHFFGQISDPATYPTIGWLDFSNSCTTWKIFDKKLKSSDVDRVFIV